MISDVTIQLRVKVEIHFQEEYVLPKEFFFYSQNCDKTLATIIFDSNKGHFIQKERVIC